MGEEEGKVGEPGRRVLMETHLFGESIVQSHLFHPCAPPSPNEVPVSRQALPLAGNRGNGLEVQIVKR